MAATIIEKAKGTGYVSSHIYGSASFVALWGVTAAISIIYLIRRNVHKRPWTFMLHASFVIIICGAGITHWCGEQGTVHLRTGDDAVTGFVRDDGTTAVMPFGIRLDRFAVAYYPGTRSPMDFTSSVTVTDGISSLTADVSMNDIFTHDGYRFYQSSYDSRYPGGNNYVHNYVERCSVTGAEGTQIDGEAEGIAHFIAEYDIPEDAIGNMDNAYALIFTTYETDTKFNGAVLYAIYDDFGHIIDNVVTIPLNGKTDYEYED